MNNNRPPASNFQKSERETGNQVSLALVKIKIEGAPSTNLDSTAQWIELGAAIKFTYAKSTHQHRHDLPPPPT